MSNSTIIENLKPLPYWYKAKGTFFVKPFCYIVNRKSDNASMSRKLFDFAVFFDDVWVYYDSLFTIFIVKSIESLLFVTWISIPAFSNDSRMLHNSSAKDRDIKRTFTKSIQSFCAFNFQHFCMNFFRFGPGTKLSSYQFLILQ